MAQTASQAGSVEGQGAKQRTARQHGLAWAALLGFVVAGILLIILTWRDNLSTQDAGTPAYYRDTFVVDESVYATVTAEAAQNLATPAPAPPEPERP